MATIAASPADRKASERRFYSRMALFLALLVLLGFGPSFYLRNIVPAYPRPNPTLPLAVILHGTVFTLWMAAIIAQTQLISARKHEIHMRLGKLTMQNVTLTNNIGLSDGELIRIRNATSQLKLKDCILYGPNDGKVKVLNTAPSGTGRIISASAGRKALFFTVIDSVVTAI